MQRFDLWYLQPTTAIAIHPFDYPNGRCPASTTNAPFQLTHLNKKIEREFSTAEQMLADDATRLLYAFGCKILKYFGLAGPTNSPTKTSAEARVMKRNFDAGMFIQKMRAAQSPLDPFNQEIRRVELRINKYHGPFQNTLHLLKNKLDQVDMGEFVRFAKNWGIEFEQQDQYDILRKAYMCDLVVFMCFIKRFPQINLAHIDFFKTISESHRQIDFFAIQEEEFAKMLEPCEFYAMDLPDAIENVELDNDMMVEDHQNSYRPTI